jgi:hypothetical protein
MRPTDFYALLYSELTLILEGWRARCSRALRERREESAWLASRLLLPHQKRDADPITPDQLMGRKPRGKPKLKLADYKESASAFFAALEAKSKKR